MQIDTHPIFFFKIELNSLHLIKNKKKLIICLLVITLCICILYVYYTAVLDLVDESGNILDYNSFTLKHGFACHPKQFFTVINAMKILIRV